MSLTKLSCVEFHIEISLSHLFFFFFFCHTFFKSYKIASIRKVSGVVKKPWKLKERKLLSSLHLVFSGVTEGWIETKESWKEVRCSMLVVEEKLWTGLT